MFALFGEFKEEARKAYDPEGDKEFTEVITRFNTDWVWGEPARFVANSFEAIGEPAYLFLFSYIPSHMKERMTYGPGHGTDISYVFNNLGIGGFGPPPPPPTDQDKELARMMNTYWANFARTGNPNGKGVPQWPVYNLKKNGIAPKAIINKECETIVAVGCIISEIPCVDHIEIDKIKTGDKLSVDAEKGIVEKE